MILGKCHHCRKSIYYVVDLLRGSHEKCNEKHEAGIRKIEKMVRHTSKIGANLQKLENEIQRIARSSYIRKKNTNEHVFKGWELAARELLQDGLPSESAEKNLLAVLDYFAMPKKKTRSSETYRNLKHLPFLRMVSAGHVPPTIPNAKKLHFNLMPSETLFWVFAKVEYCESIDRQILESHNEIMRNGIGLSDRVLIIRILKRVDVAWRITNIHLYFDGQSRRFRIPFRRIAFLEPATLGVSLVQDGQDSVPQEFRLSERWFAYNLLAILAGR